ncbi:MAG TPA: hypothetical protein VFW87_09390 [Pirellulales bacterium]|nr:hypothetical protein [Pirellulales bacterium]
METWRAGKGKRATDLADAPGFQGPTNERGMGAMGLRGIHSAPTALLHQGIIYVVFVYPERVHLN